MHTSGVTIIGSAGLCQLPGDHLLPAMAPRTPHQCGMGAHSLDSTSLSACSPPESLADACECMEAGGGSSLLRAWRGGAMLCPAITCCQLPDIHSVAVATAARAL